MALLAATSNPTIDQTLFAPHLSLGRVHRAAACGAANALTPLPARFDFAELDRIRPRVRPAQI